MYFAKKETLKVKSYALFENENVNNLKLCYYVGNYNIYS